VFELELAYALEKNSMPVPDFLYKHSAGEKGIFDKLKAGMRSQISKRLNKVKGTYDLKFNAEQGKLKSALIAGRKAKVAPEQLRELSQAVTLHRNTHTYPLASRIAGEKALEGKGLLSHAGEYALNFKGRAAAAGAGTLAAGGGAYVGGRSLYRKRKRRQMLTSPGR